jgi:hypothetical protein
LPHLGDGFVEVNTFLCFNNVSNLRITGCKFQKLLQHEICC